MKLRASYRRKLEKASFEDERGTGRTTRQMQDAKPGSLFIWCNPYLDYPKSLARRLGRTDLVIKAPSCLSGQALHGTNYPEIILDHAAYLYLSAEQTDMLHYLRRRMGL